jgi:hypothetical protein
MEREEYIAIVNKAKAEYNAIEKKEYDEFRAIEKKAWAKYRKANTAVTQTAEYNAETEMPRLFGMSLTTHVLSTVEYYTKVRESRAKYEAVKKKAREEYIATVNKAKAEYIASHPV